MGNVNRQNSEIGVEIHPMIPIPGFMNLDNELTLKFKWYITSPQPYTHVF